MKIHDGFENIPCYAHEDFYPNIRGIFIILLTLPVTNVCCERSFSSLRRLKTWEKATMGEDKLCSLAMLHIHRDLNVSRENTLRRFNETGHRTIGRLQFWMTIHIFKSYILHVSHIVVL